MLIKFGFSDADFAAADQALLFHVVTQVLLSHRSGHHLVVLDRSQCSWLKTNLGLRSPASSTLDRIATAYTQTGGLLQRASKALSIVPTCHPWLVDKGALVEVSLDRVADDLILHRVALVVEDIVTDAELYSIVLKSVASRRQLPPVSWEPIHGGGDRTRWVWKATIQSRRVVCALIDSDDHVPTQGISPKVTALDQIAENEKWPLAAAATPKCRELENLFPLAVLEQLPCSTTLRQLIQDLADVEMRERAASVPHESSLSFYFDVKEGLDHAKLATRSKAIQDWYEGKLALLGVTMTGCVWPGFGANVSSQVLADKKLFGEIHAAVRSDRYLNIFDHFFERVLWLCAASPRVIT